MQNANRSHDFGGRLNTEPLNAYKLNNKTNAATGLGKVLHNNLKMNLNLVQSGRRGGTRNYHKGGPNNMVPIS